MEVKQLLEQIQQQYNEWKQERDQEQVITEIDHVQEYLAAQMYESAVMLRKDSDNLQSLVNGLYELESILEKDCTFERCKRIFANVSALREPARTERLVGLMNYMEEYFKIPMMNNEEYNKKNPHVIELYRAASAARNL